MKTITEPKIMTLKQALNNYKKSNFYQFVPEGGAFLSQLIFFEKFRMYLLKKGIKVKMSAIETASFVLGRQNTTGSIDRFIEFSEE